MAWSIAVRCCCEPSRILGFVTIHEPPKVGCWYSFPLLERTAFKDVKPPAVQHSISLQADTVKSWQTLRTEYALRSDETPIDTLRKIPGWREVNRLVEPGTEGQ